jgi:hypothetical protein
MAPLRRRYDSRDEYKIFGSEDDGKIMVISGRDGWDLKFKKQDGEESKLSEEGERRYAGLGGYWEGDGAFDQCWERVVGGENARLSLGTDGGIFSLGGLTNSYSPRRREISF